MKRLLVALALLLAACGEDVSYVPAAYGVPGQCYYVESPLEVNSLYAHHLCPTTWVPTPMPFWWHTRYAGFYDSSAYYNVYVPSSYRQTYVQHVTVFETKNQSAIDKSLSSGNWKTTSGQKVSGSDVADAVRSGDASFGGGKARSAGFASGSVRSNIADSDGSGKFSAGGKPLSGGNSGSKGGGGYSGGGARGGGFSGGGARGGK